MSYGLSDFQSRSHRRFLRGLRCSILLRSQVLWHQANRSRQVVRARSRRKRLLDFCVFLFCAKCACNTDARIHLRVDRGFVLAWAWIHVRLANAEVAPDTRADEVRHVGVVNWNDIGLVFAGAGLVQGLAHEVLRLDAHVEFWLVLGLVEVALEDVVAWTRNLGFCHNVLPLSVTDRSFLQIICSVQARVLRIVGLRAHVTRLLHLGDVFGISLGLVGMLDDPEARNGEHLLLAVGAWTRSVLFDLIIWLQGAAKNRLGIFELVLHFIFVDISMWIRKQRLLCQLRIVGSCRQRKRVAVRRFGIMLYMIFVWRWRILRQGVEAPALRSECRSWDR